MSNRFLRFALSWVLTIGLAGCTATDQRQTDAAQSTIAACTDLVLDYALYRDLKDVEKTAGLFAADARMTLQGQTFIGRESIRERMRSLGTGPKTRHLMSTIRITPISADRATGVSYVAVYAAVGEEGQQQKIDGFAVVGNYIDEFVRTPQGWKIASRRLEVAFSSAALP